MKAITVLLLIALGIILFVLIVALWYTKSLTDAGPGNCYNVKQEQPDVKWSSDCTYIEEIEDDSSITSPGQPLYMLDFTASPSLGPALSAYTWYRYRYVEAKTGKSSNFSPWTSSPIIAGGDNFPCKEKECTGVSTGNDSCNSNLVRLGIDVIDYSIDSGYYANVHRYNSSSPDVPGDTQEDAIVGMLMPSAGVWKFIDIKSPCSGVNADCGVTLGC